MAVLSDLEAQPLRQGPAAQPQPIPGEDAFLDIAEEIIALPKRNAGETAFGVDGNIAKVETAEIA